MTAPELLASLAASGVSVRIEGDALKLRPAAALDDALRGAIIELKPELLLLLANGLSTPTPDTAPPSDVQRIRKLAAQVSPAEFGRARKTIAPDMRRACTSEEIHELILAKILLEKPTGKSEVNE